MEAFRPQRRSGGAPSAAARRLRHVAAAAASGEEGDGALVQHFRERGFASLPGLLDPAQVARLQTAFRREQADLEAAAAGRGGDVPRYRDIPRVIETDDVYLELLDSERVALLLQRVVGGDAHAVCVQARALPPAAATQDSDTSYAPWHRDYERSVTDLELHGPFDHPLLSTAVKLFVCVSDTDESMAPTTFVPATHRLPEGPPPLHDTQSMPGAVRFTGKAGDAMLVDIRCWHAAGGPNLSDRPRESIIIQYAGFKWQQTGSLIASARRLDEQGRIDAAADDDDNRRPRLRQILGLEIAECMADRRPPTPASDIMQWPRTWPNPHPPQSLLPSGAVAAEVAEFRANGCVMLRGLLQGEMLQRLQSDFRREQATARRAWMAQTGSDEREVGQSWNSSEKRRYFDLAGDTVLETSPAYAALLNSDRLYSLLEAVVGEDVKCVELSARTVPGNDGRHSYTTWHRDFGRHGAGEQWNFPFDHPTLSEDVKLFFNVFDTTEKQGCTAVVPGSHRLLGGPQEMSGLEFAGGGSAGAALDAMGQQNTLIKLAGKAGDAMLADIRIWHTAMENTTPQPRESLIMMFSPFWRKGGLELEASSRRLVLEAASGGSGQQLLTPRLRQMLGLELMGGGGNIYDPEYLEIHPRPDLM